MSGTWCKTAEPWYKVKRAQRCLWHVRTLLCKPPAFNYSELILVLIAWARLPILTKSWCATYLYARQFREQSTFQCCNEKDPQQSGSSPGCMQDSYAVLPLAQPTLTYISRSGPPLPQVSFQWRWGKIASTSQVRECTVWMWSLSLQVLHLH